MEPCGGGDSASSPTRRSTTASVKAVGMLSQHTTPRQPPRRVAHQFAEREGAHPRPPESSLTAPSRDRALPGPAESLPSSTTRARAQPTSSQGRSTHRILGRLHAQSSSAGPSRPATDAHGRRAPSRAVDPKWTSESKGSAARPEARSSASHEDASCVLPNRLARQRLRKGADLLQPASIAILQGKKLAVAPKSSIYLKVIGVASNHR